MSGAFDRAGDRDFAGVQAVDPSHGLDVMRLAAWLDTHVEGFVGPLEVSQFKGGQSNPTYRLTTPGREYVLRRKPPGDLLPSAHAVEREFRVLAAVGAAGIPAPMVYALCEDREVMGSAFYVMEMVEGRVLWDLSLPDLEPAERRMVVEAQVAVLAALHNLDVDTIGLTDFGRPGDYFERQIARWTRQYRSAETTVIPDMERLIAWLPVRRPAAGRRAIVHGDYRLDNMVLHPTTSEVRAVLDWELSTVGDPLADLAWFLMAWILPASERAGFRGMDPVALGIPSQEDVITQYAALTGRDGDIDLDWLMAFTLFRLACIVQGIAGRVRAGIAKSPHALTAEARVPLLAAVGWGCAARAGG